VQSSTLDLAQNEAPAEWHKFDRIISCCVLEHLPRHLQETALARLAGLLKTGGVFVLTFDYGENAPVNGAIRDEQEVERLIASSGLSPIGNRRFLDTKERFPLDKRYPNHDFTFGSVFLQK
jgi:cyclopropane fatty-acyl-phospholipid synthase-like methyltransferase